MRTRSIQTHVGVPTEASVRLFIWSVNQSLVVYRLVHAPVIAQWLTRCARKRGSTPRQGVFLFHQLSLGFYRFTTPVVNAPRRRLHKHYTSVFVGCVCGTLVLEVMSVISYVSDWSEATRVSFVISVSVLPLCDCFLNHRRDLNDRRGCVVGAVSIRAALRKCMMTRQHKTVCITRAIL